MTATPLGAIFFLGGAHRTVLSALRGMSFLGENLERSGDGGFYMKNF
jgi:hypothetical protein